MQAETLASAYRLWRRNWKGKGREYTAGALVWQVRASMCYQAQFGLKFAPDQRLLACDILGHCRLLPTAQTLLLYYLS